MLITNTQICSKLVIRDAGNKVRGYYPDQLNSEEPRETAGDGPRAWASKKHEAHIAFEPVSTLEAPLYD